MLAIPAPVPALALPAPALPALAVPALAFVALVFAAACTAPADHSDAPLAAVELELTPEARIDGVEHDIVSIVNPTVRPGDILAFGDRYDLVVHLFDAGGERLGTIGGRGEGPGELMLLSDIGWVGDTLWVWDYRLRRISYLEPSSPPRLIRAVTLGQLAPARHTGADAARFPSFSSATPIARYPDGSFLATLRAPTGVDAERYQETNTFARILDDGSIVRILSSDPEPPQTVMLRAPEGSTVGVGLPWGNRSVSDVTGDGGRLVTAHASLDGPDAGAIRIVAFGPAGDTIYRRHVAFMGAPIPQAEVDSVIDARVELARTTQVGFNVGSLPAAFRNAVTVPPMRPPLRDLIVGREGGVWVRFRDGAEAIPWLFLDPAGRLVGRVSEPPGNVIAARGDRVWIAEAGDVGVSNIVRYVVSGR